MKIKESEHEYAIRCNSTLGPSFGVDDICIYANGNGCSNLGAVYIHPEEAQVTSDTSFLVGSYQFKLSGIEVYQKK